MSQIIVPVTKNPDLNSPCEWVIPPIQLYNDDDEVIWHLDELSQAYPGGEFRIEFTSWPKDPDPVPVDGPFSNPIVAGDMILSVMKRNHEWGTYIYDIVVSYQEGRFLLETPIDPQIDNLAPPPNTPIQWSGRREEREVRETETVETTVRR